MFYTLRATSRDCDSHGFILPQVYSLSCGISSRYFQILARWRNFGYDWSKSTTKLESWFVYSIICKYLNSGCKFTNKFEYAKPWHHFL
jgi:hypothetical protein